MTGELQKLPGEDLARESERAAMAALDTAKAVVVTTPDQFEAAGRILAQIKGKIKEVEAQRRSITDPMNASVKAVNDLFRRPKEALEAAAAYYERPMAEYKREEERNRREAEARAREEQERLRREAEAKAAEERKKLEDERKAKEELDRKAKEAEEAAQREANPVVAFMKRQEAEQLQTQAKEQGARVDEARESVTNALRESVTIQAPVDYVPQARAAGLSTRKHYSFKIVDAALIPREYLIPDEKKIGDVVRAEKMDTNIPGVEVVEDFRIGGR